MHYSHRGTGENIARSDNDRIPDFFGECGGRRQFDKFFPLRLVYTKSIEQRTKFIAVFGPVDVVRVCAEDEDVLLGQFGGEGVWNLSSHGNDNALGGDEVNNVPHTLLTQFLEEENIAFVVVCTDGFRIAVDHDHLKLLPLEFVHCLHAAPVKLYGGADGVRASPEDDDPFLMSWGVECNVRFCSVVGEVEIVRLGGEFTGECVDLLHDRGDLVPETLFPHFFRFSPRQLCDAGVRKSHFLRLEEKISFRNRSFPFQQLGGAHACLNALEEPAVNACGNCGFFNAPLAVQRFRKCE